MPDLCYCGSGNSFEQCCQIYISGLLPAPTAEALMRSRYSAYASSSVVYLIQTSHASIREELNEADLRKWCKSNQWKKLRIESVKAGAATDATGEVTFKAFFLDSRHRLQEHHERSSFVKENGHWYYLSGVFL